MSEFLAAAASKTGVPEELLQRAAAARAEASGSTTDALLEAWAGGEAAPAGAAVAAPETPATSSQPPAEPAGAPEPAAAEADAAAVAVADAIPEPAAPVTPAAVFSRESVAPVLTGRADNPLVLVLGAIGLLVLGAVFGVLLPSLDIAEAALGEEHPQVHPQRGQAVFVGLDRNRKRRSPLRKPGGMPPTQGMPLLDRHGRRELRASLPSRQAERFGPADRY